MNEIFSDNVINNVIRVDKHICTHRNEPFGCVTERLFAVFNQVNSFNNIKDKKERIIKKAAHLLGGIVWQQPFSNGNKRTALAVTIHFLRKNGFTISLKTRKEEKEMFCLLEKTMLKSEGDDTIIPEVEDYLRRKVFVV